jgi:hypothetical protein
MAATDGHIVLTPGAKEPYKVVLEHEGAKDTEHPVLTIREGEALIKQETPIPPKRDATFDHPAYDASQPDNGSAAAGRQQNR